MRMPVGDFGVELIEEGDRTCWHLRHGGDWEPRTLSAWSSICTVSRGRTVVDVGAYSGVFAISAALRGCHAMAFEPVPRNAKRVAENAALNGAYIALFDMVLGDTVGTARLRYNAALKDMTSGGSIAPTEEQATKRGYEWLDVPCRTLDSFNLQDVAAIKIDVERAEPAVLRGAVETLARCKPILIVEVLGNEEKAAVKAAVKGYEVAEVLDGRNWLMVPA